MSRGRRRPWKIGSLWRWLLLALVAAVLAVGFFTPVKFYVNGPFWYRLMDATHFPIFFALAALIHWLSQSLMLSPRASWWLSAGAATALAVGVEMAQPAFGRSADWHDLSSGLAGALAYFAVAKAFERPRRPGVPLAATLLAICIAIGFAWPAATEAYGMYLRRQLFPVLGDFEREGELIYWRGESGNSGKPTELTIVSDGAGPDQLLRVQTHEGSWTGLSYWGEDQDWTPYSTLEFALHVDEEPIPATLLLEDQSHREAGNKATMNLALEPGWHNYAIPLEAFREKGGGEGFKLDHIRRFVLILGADQPPKTLHLDKVRLR